MTEILTQGSTIPLPGPFASCVGDTGAAYTACVNRIKQGLANDPVNQALGALAQGVYDLTIGPDISTLHSNADWKAKAFALADIALTVVPAEKLVKAASLVPRLVDGVAKVLHLHVSPPVLDEAAKLIEKGGGEAVACALCFPADTQVATPHGLTAIQSMHVGDQVLAENPAAGRVEAEVVQAVIQDPISPLIAVELSDGSAITVTKDHPFWVDLGVASGRGGWLAAGDLRPGMRLHTAGGPDVVVLGVRPHVGRAAVYTLTVAHDHTFFVGAARVLVHNSDCPIAWIRIEDLPPVERQAVEEAVERITGQRPPLTGRLGRNWGAEFGNNELNLPTEPRGYYHEYTVLLPNATSRGVLRLITGARGEVYYTWTHYGQSGVPAFVRLR